MSPSPSLSECFSVHFVFSGLPLSFEYPPPALLPPLHTLLGLPEIFQLHVDTIQSFSASTLNMSFVMSHTHSIFATLFSCSQPYSVVGLPELDFLPSELSLLKISSPRAETKTSLCQGAVQPVFVYMKFKIIF